MKTKSLFKLLGLVAVLATFGTAALGKDFCKENEDWGDTRSERKLIEKTIASRGLLEVDGRKNGGISVKGEDRKDISILACVQAWSRESREAARQLVEKVSISTDGVIRASGEENDTHWSVSYQILVPREIGLKLTTHNGGVAIAGVTGNINFEAYNGGISVRDAGGDVRGRTKNGGIAVTLAGSQWRGSGLDLETTNGGVSLSVPSNFAGEIESSTVHGGFSSNLPGLSVERGRWTGGRASGKVNGGGAKVRVVTVNGGVSIRTKEM
jgi:hypothetical protein